MGTHKKWIYMVAGFLLIGGATLGVVLPLLPTTPLLLLAAWCFAQSSEKCHQWLMEHPVFGSTIKGWHANRCIPRKAKTIAIASILTFGTYAIGFVINNLYIRIIGTTVLLIGLTCVLRIKMCTEPPKR